MIELLTLSLLLLTILVLAIIIKQKWSSVLSLILIPFLIFNIGFSWYTIDDLWGHPRHQFSKEEMEILTVIIKKPDIYLLAKGSTDVEPIFYKIPYTEKTEKALKEAQKRMKSGVRVMIKKFQGKENDNSEFKLYDWDHKNLLKKEN